MNMQKEHDPLLHIRPARPSDNMLLAEVGAETFSGSFAAENTPEDMTAYLAESFGPEKQARELADPATRFLIVEEDGLTVGYAQLRLAKAPAAVAGRKPLEIVRFYARKPWIGTGIGAPLMQACLHEAEHAGCDMIWLDVWERNARAIAFYQKWGFVERGTQAFRLGEDLQRDLLMARAVSLGSV